MRPSRLPVSVSAGGWVVLALAVLGIGAGLGFGWTELLVAGLIALVVALVSALFLLGRGSGRIAIEVLDRQVVAGQPASVAVRVSNDSAVTRRAQQAEFAVGGRIEFIRLPSVSAGGTSEVVVEVPTERRGVIPLGPVTVVRRDPFGLARRESVRSETAELFVHPPTVTLGVSTTGLLRDLEGIPTSDLTDSDMSFHALRGYVPGDDRRHIHWRSTAKTGAFLVRQFEQTRRSHLIVLQSLSQADHATPEEFELVVSVVASLGVRAVLDGTTVSVFAGAPAASAARAGSAARSVSVGRAASAARGSSTRRRRGPGAASGGRLRTRTPRQLLDDLSTIEESGTAPRLSAVARAAGEAATDASVVFLACGSTVTARELRAAASHFATGVEVIAVVADPEAVASLVRIDALRITRIGYLDDLVRTLTRAVGV
ncbi:DUF58 domain-containing protein [Herbiconiux solani]|uniref:DUF58 domain-containing protein n=1 Tax=Herbiconiux solani TaxID=661329 RepID=UPI000825FE06|nr:DUF58 domain-containing protein [Herbiconiux solani]